MRRASLIITAAAVAAIFLGPHHSAYAESELEKCLQKVIEACWPPDSTDNYLQCMDDGEELCKNQSVTTPPANRPGTGAGIQTLGNPSFKQR